jgi:uncharacterized membrane protein YqaE (UPF0057 family)
MSKLILVIIAILLPPLAAYLATKSVKNTLINLVLTFFFYVPGLLHALYLILK